MQPLFSSLHTTPYQGPLANTAHHPAWGRISETYSEDPYVVSAVGSTATAVMQGRDRGVLRTALTTRHYMGYHATNTMPIPTITVTERDLYDAYLPGYRALSIEGAFAWAMHTHARAHTHIHTHTHAHALRHHRLKTRMTRVTHARAPL
jgi:beta-glucosidase-like glycosyl hydrolase